MTPAEKLLMKMEDEDIEALRSKGVDLTSREEIVAGIFSLMEERGERGIRKDKWVRCLEVE